MRWRDRPGSGTGADRRGWFARCGADRAGPDLHVCRPPAALSASAIYGRQGIQRDRFTLADWVGRDKWYLRPLRDCILEQLRRSERLFADETTVPVLVPETGRTKIGQLWAYALIIDYGAAQIRQPSPTSTRAIARPNGHGSISAVSTASCRSMVFLGFAALARRRQQVRLAFCWAHVRRKCFELADTPPVATDAPR